MTKTDQELVQNVKTLLTITMDYMTELAQRDITVSFGISQLKEGSQVTGFRASKLVKVMETVPFEATSAPGASPTA